MNSIYLSAATLRDHAKDKLSGRFPGCIRAVLFIFALQLTMQNLCVSIDDALYKAFAQSGLSPQLAVIIETVISFSIEAFIFTLLHMLFAGVALYFMKLSINQWSIVSDLFFGFREEPTKTLKVSALSYLPTMIPMLPYVLLAAMYVETKGKTYLIAAIVAFLIGAVIRIFFSLSLGLSFFFMLDFPELDALEITKSCWQKTKGHRIRLLLLELSFLPLMALSVFTFFIGMLWIYPYYLQAKAEFYLDMMKPVKPY